MQIGKTKDQGLYNKRSAAVHPGALAAGTLPQYNTIIPRSTGLGISFNWQIQIVRMIKVHSSEGILP